MSPLVQVNSLEANDQATSGVKNTGVMGQGSSLEACEVVDLDDAGCTGVQTSLNETVICLEGIGIKIATYVKNRISPLKERRREFDDE